MSKRVVDFIAPELYTRPDGVVHAWREAGTFFEYDGENYVVLYAAPNPDHCLDCYLRRYTCERCLELRRGTFGECNGMCRGDGKAVIFHKVGTKVNSSRVRAVNVQEGLGKYI